MLLFCAVGAFFFGLVVGSFLNVVVYRVPRGLSIVSPGSACPNCRQLIAAQDNIPVLSWLFLRGRCRHCGQGISARYPATELVTGVVFMAVAVTVSVIFPLSTSLIWALLWTLVGWIAASISIAFGLISHDQKRVR